ncbi:uncharacterized protein LOC106647195 [Copidosoma floridanum]|uniref:uncharacterized protein LOC106647195 n=1 Tax=Copidosoma floridanum TaxID=29053 RepID=UPI0006C9D499|nr:uncharacterized protein LOC106647195 [Copidosoma floridanum]
MARHRDVRSMNYTDEYDEYDDVYGRSAEDDYCISPSVEQFMFDRSKQANISSYFTEPDIEEDNEEAEEESAISGKSSELSELDKAKLLSCVEAVKNIIGDTCSDAELNKKIVQFNYNTEAVINSILSEQTDGSRKEKQKGGKILAQAQSDSHLKNPLSSISSNFSSMNFKNCYDTSDNTQESSSTSAIISETPKSVKDSSSSNPSLSCLAGLSAHHLNMPEKKSNIPSGFTIPKMSFGNPKPSNPIELPSFDSLSDLTAHHLKISNEKAESKGSFSSPSAYIIPKINIKNEKQSFSSLADLTAQHLKIASQKDLKTNLPSQFDTIKGIKLEKPDTPSVSSISDLNINCSEKQENSETNSPCIAPKSIIQIKKEKLLESEISKNEPQVISIDFANLKIKEEKLDAGDLNMETLVSEFDSSIIIKQEKLDADTSIIINQAVFDTNNSIIVKQEKLDTESCHNKKMHNNLLECLLDTLKKENTNIRGSKNATLKKTVSSFGKILCKKYKRKRPYQRNAAPKSEESKKNSENRLTRFDFSSPSPDAYIQARLRARMNLI